MPYWVHWERTEDGAEASVEMHYPTLAQASRDLPHELTVCTAGDLEPSFVTDHLAAARTLQHDDDGPLLARLQRAQTAEGRAAGCRSERIRIARISWRTR